MYLPKDFSREDLRRSIAQSHGIKEKNFTDDKTAINFQLEQPPGQSCPKRFIPTGIILALLKDGAITGVFDDSAWSDLQRNMGKLTVGEVLNFIVNKRSYKT